jgi:hypothetical protein
MPSPTERYYPSLIDGDTDETLALFGGEGDVHDPFGVPGAYMFYMWAGGRHIWLHHNQARLEDVRTTRAGSRAVVEYVVQMEYRAGYPDARKVALPVAVVGEEAGDRLVRARVYHSMWPMFGKHDRRPAILDEDPELLPGDVVGAYHRALAAGDVEGVLSTLEPEAVVREPSGGEYVYRTAEEHRKFYSAILARGGIRLQKCTITDDGVACALEYNVARWGETNLWPVQAGVAVYERSPRGRLSAVRIYDDVNPPE